MSAVATAPSGPISVSVLSPNDMGKLRHEKPLTPKASGEAFLKAYVTQPTSIVSQLIGASHDDWAKEESRLVHELSTATDKPSREAVKKRIPALVPARFDGFVRNGDSVLGRQVIGHDFDHVEAGTFEAACDKIRAQLPDRFLAIHSTSTERNEDGTWRLRALEILDREASKDEWDTRVKPHMRGVGEHDPKALDVVRFLYMPIRTAGYRFHVYDGPRTRLDDLAAAPPPKTEAPAPKATGTVRESSRKAAVGLLAAVWPPQGNGRHAAQLALAGGLCRAGWPEADAVAFLCEVCARAGDEDRDKREKTVKDTYRRAATGKQFAAWGALSQQLGATVIDHARLLLSPDVDTWEEFAQELEREAAANDTSGRRFEIVSAAGLAVPVPPVDYVLRHFGIAPGRPSLLAGYGGGGKTILVQCLALHMAAGVGSCWGLPIATGPVLHIDYEMTLDPIRRRYQRLATAYDLGLAGCALEAVSMPSIYLSDTDAEEALFEVCTGRRLCIIDNLAAATASAVAKENESAIRKYLDVLTRVSARTNCTFLVLVHERKAGKDEQGGLQRVRGSSAITDASGSVISITVGDGDGIVTLSQTKTSHRKKGDEINLKIEDTDVLGNTVDATGEEDSAGLRVVRVEDRPLDEQAKVLRASILALLVKPQATIKDIEARLKVRKGGAVGNAVKALIVLREVVFIKGEGYSLDNPVKRTERILAALRGPATLTTHAQIAKAAHVDADEVRELEIKGTIITSGKSWMVHPDYVG